MKLYLLGHNYKYATEQMLLTLFPTERPEYPLDLLDDGAHTLTLSLHTGPTWTTARAVLIYCGVQYVGIARTGTSTVEQSTVERDRGLTRVLKNAFYRAGTQALGQEPPWGALTGVRPVKLPTKVLLQGGTRAEADRQLKSLYRVSSPRRRLALDCAEASLRARQALAAGDLSLYVGIPFCPTRCTYCSFVSSAVGHMLGQIEPYLNALCEEIGAAGRATRQNQGRVRSVYLGGGTPTTLSAPQLDRLLLALRSAFDLSACLEFTVEAGRPDTITADKLAVLRAHGVDRVSVNPQTLQDTVLKAVGRPHTAEDVETAWAMAQQAGFAFVNMDLIAGLPTDTKEGFAHSLEWVIAHRPENVTVHTLALKKGSRLTTEGAILPLAEVVSEMLEYAWTALRTAGYSPYYLYRQKYMSGGFENVGWCLPGAESFYNICMMEELSTILSLGAGGITKLVSPSAGSLIRRSNPKYPKEYIEQIPRIAAEKEKLIWPIN